MIRPAEGEGAAVAGYHYQYLASSALVLRGLMDETLTWVRIKDVNAGRVDDFVVGYKDRVDGYQFKHRAARTFTFRNLTHGELRDTTASQASQGGHAPGVHKRQQHHPPLIRQLADGWNLLGQSHGSRVVVHLTTNAPSSKNDRIEVPDDTVGPRHFTAFLSEVWQRVHLTAEDVPLSIPSKWRPAWDTLRETSGLDDENFARFARDCRFEFEVEPVTVLGVDASRDSSQARADIDRIRHLLFDAAALEQGPIALQRGDLLERLGWTVRFRSRNPHVFPVDAVLYQPIRASVDELEAKLAAITRGYLGVFGSPGSGKSTLLTQVLRYRTERVVRYYAFVPEASGPDIGRGEAESFLHDLVLALHREGFSAGNATIGFERLMLLDRLYAQLHLLHENWRATGTKTLILVDGLDHVEREPHPDRPFLWDLPLPDQVPEGVVFVLGSQMDAVLPNQIRSVILEAGRRIEMQPLSREEILTIVGKAGLPVELSREQQTRVVELSAGHPLALVYLLNAVKQTNVISEVQAILDQTLSFTGDIASRYLAAWSEVEDNHAAVEVLGYAARFRGPADLSWLEVWLGHAPVREVRRRFGHFFRHERDGRVYFFHDSFRAFLLERTAETWRDHFDPNRDATFHRELADRCSQEPPESSLAWEELYHRSRAGQDDVVVQRATQGFFRSQVLALRPIEAVSKDVTLALRSAAKIQDPISFSRLVLAGAELGQRESHLEQVPFVQLLIDLGQPLIAVEHLREGHRLRSTALTALKACQALVEGGLSTEAARIFELAEPLDLLGSGRPIDDDPHTGVRPLLLAWAEVAPRYHSVERIIRLVRQLRILPAGWHQSSPEEATRELQDAVIFHAGLGLIDERRWDDLATVLEDLDPATGATSDWWFWLHKHAWQAAARGGEHVTAHHFLDAVLGRFSSEALGPEERITVATAALWIIKDERLSHQWIEGIPQPTFDPLHVGLNSKFEPFEQRFQRTRLLYALGKNPDPSGGIDGPPNVDERGVTQFERLVDLVACTDGRGKHGEQLLRATLVAALEPYLHLFDRHLDYRTMGTSWYVAERARAGLVRRLVRAAARHGEEALDAVRAKLEQAWGETPWANEDRRAAILALVQAGVSRAWGITALGVMQADLLSRKLTFERIDECQRQSEAWLALGELEAARTMLSRLLVESNAVAFRKDHQIATWINQWLSDVNRVDPDGASGRILWFAKATLILRETTEEGADRSSAEALLGATYRWSPCRAVRFLRWCQEHELVALDDALTKILTVALGGPNAPVSVIRSLVAEVVILIAMDGPSPLLLKRLLENEKPLSGERGVIDTVELLAVRAATWAAPSSRRQWHRNLVAALKPLAIDIHNCDLTVLGTEDDVPWDQPPLTPLLLQDGAEVSFQDVKHQATSVATMCGLIEREVPESFFDWSPIVTRVGANATREEIANVVKLFRERRNGANVLSRLGEVLMARGDRYLAREIYLAAFDATHTFGWERRWGGGETIDAARRLVELDRESAVPRVYERLVEDLSTEPGYFGTVAGNLREILPLLVDPVPVRAIWTEFEDFIQALLAGHDLPESDLDWLNEPPLNDGPGAGLARLLTMLLQSPALAVTQAAQRVCAQGILSSEPTMLSVAREGLHGPTDLQLAVLQALHAVALEAPDMLAPFRANLVGLGSSPDFAVRATAREICANLGWEPSTPPRIARPMSYAIVLPPSPPSEIRPFERHLVMVADVANVSRDAVMWRAAKLMRELSDPESWSAAAERWVAAELHNARVYLPYRRPRARASRSALFRIVAELSDCGTLDESALSLIASLLRIHDPAMVMMQPSRRPEWIERMDEPDYGEGGQEVWLGQIEEASTSHGEKLSKMDDVVLAEKTEFRRVDMRLLSEYRSVVVEQLDHLSIHDHNPVGLRHVAGRSLAEYPSSAVRQEPLSLVIQNVEHNAYDTPAPSWLALNPVVAQDLGWHFAEGTLPRWLDSAGKAMVWSVWWTDGMLDTTWGAPPNQVSEGWLVLASPEGFAELRGRFSQLRSRMQLTRRLEAGEGQPARERVYEKIVVIPT